MARLKDRADRILVSRGLTDSRQKARALIMAGQVYSGRTRIEKAGLILEEDVPLEIREKMPFVSRGGLKLAHALSAFRVEVTGRTAVDLGSSTGGFTDCLLQKGAAKVIAVDVDPRQFDWRLGQDPRIILVKKNARYLRSEDIPAAFDLVTVDLSFISVLKVLPAVKRLMDGGDVLPLIKPQFEVGRPQVGKKGLVKDATLHFSVLTRITEEVQTMGFFVLGITSSPIKGQKGNREFFLHLSVGEGPKGRISIEDSIKEAVWDESD
jgi:23S rRNA (cytidine1920-2'-O)/16S rRNA (cytidine1409-2'-O)-methyltransferase